MSVLRLSKLKWWYLIPVIIFILFFYLEGKWCSDKEVKLFYFSEKYF